MKMKHHLLALSAMGLLGSSAFALTHVTADITADTKWTTAGSPYILEQLIYVKNGATLDIAPGVIIRGQPWSGSVSIADAGALAVTTNSKIQARGTASAPIIFTTAARDVDANGAVDKTGGFPVRWTATDGDAGWLDANPVSAPLPPLDTLGAKNMSLWGGVILLGDAPTNNGNQVDIDADTILDDGFGIAEGIAGADAVYGGFNSEHNAGVMRYVSIRHGGIGIVPTKEINALTLYSVGNKTTLSYLDIYCNSDDGIEIFGGTVNLDHVNVSFADDDSLDMDEGYQGTIQFAFIYQGFGYGDHGMELDGSDEATAENQASTPLFPITNVGLYNTTVVMKKAKSGIDMDSGFAGIVANNIVVQASGLSDGTGIKVAGNVGGEVSTSSPAHFGAGDFQIRNNTVFGFATLYSAVSNTAPAWSMSATGAVSGTAFDEFYPNPLNRTLNPSLQGTSDTLGGINPRPSLAASALVYGTTLDAAYVRSPAVATSYKGAFDRTASSLWTTGWTALNKAGYLVD